MGQAEIIALLHEGIKGCVERDSGERKKMYIYCLPDGEV